MGIGPTKKPQKKDEDLDDGTQAPGAGDLSGTKSTEGLSYVRVTMDSKSAAEKILSKLFKNQLIADAQIVDNNERVYMKYRK